MFPGKVHGRWLVSKRTAAADSEGEAGETDGEETGRPPPRPTFFLEVVSMTQRTWQILKKSLLTKNIGRVI